MNHSEDIADRITRAMPRARLDAAGLCARTGIDKGVLSRILSGETTKPRHDTGRENRACAERDQAPARRQVMRMNATA